MVLYNFVEFKRERNRRRSAWHVTRAATVDKYTSRTPRHVYFSDILTYVLYARALAYPCGYVRRHPNWFGDDDDRGRGVGLYRGDGVSYWFSVTPGSCTIIIVIIITVIGRCSAAEAFRVKYDDKPRAVPHVTALCPGNRTRGRFFFFFLVRST